MEELKSFWQEDLFHRRSEVLLFYECRGIVFGKKQCGSTQQDSSSKR